MIESGIYGFLGKSLSNVMYVNTGKTKNKEKRLGTYRGANGKVEFQFWLDVVPNEGYLDKAERALQKKMSKHFDFYYGQEQFILPDVDGNYDESLQIVADCFGDGSIIKLYGNEVIPEIYQSTSLDGEGIDLRDDNPRCEVYSNNLGCDVMQRCGKSAELLSSRQKGKYKTIAQLNKETDRVERVFCCKSCRTVIQNTLAQQRRLDELLVNQPTLCSFMNG
jgi:hypothetical protein